MDPQLRAGRYSLHLRNIKKGPGDAFSRALRSNLDRPSLGVRHAKLAENLAQQARAGDATLQEARAPKQVTGFMHQPGPARVQN